MKAVVLIAGPHADLHRRRIFTDCQLVQASAGGQHENRCAVAGDPRGSVDDEVFRLRALFPGLAAIRRDVDRRAGVIFEPSAQGQQPGNFGMSFDVLSQLPGKRLEELPAPSIVFRTEESFRACRIPYARMKWIGDQAAHLGVRNVLKNETGLKHLAHSRLLQASVIDV